MQSSDLYWSDPPPQLALDPGQIHVWRASLDIPTDWLYLLERTLGADEIERANRFHFTKDRHHFVAARGCLRNILSRYLAASPVQIQFAYSSHGKPNIPDEHNPIGLRFNISHSHGVGLFAFTMDGEIGVDVECIRDDLSDKQIAQRYFSTSEVKSLQSLPDSMQNEAFFTCWTRKEAYIKARGEGLSMPLDQFDVTLEPGKPAVLLNTRPDASEVENWALQELHPGAGYVAAVAVQARILQLDYWQWPGFLDA